MMHSISPSPLYRQIYHLVRQVPTGRVVTYGQIARQLDCTPRTVGFAMAALPTGYDLPWQRVINIRGEISPRCNGDGEQVQRLLLEEEGVGFDGRGRVDLAVYGWEFTND